MCWSASVKRHGGRFPRNCQDALRRLAIAQLGVRTTLLNRGGQPYVSQQLSVARIRAE
jgi:hypothetical protein